MAIIKIQNIVKLWQILRQWRHKAARSSTKIPPDVPSGHVAIIVGTTGTRFVVRAEYLNHPVFKKLLVQAEELYGFSNQQGPISIPCDESVFEDILHFLSNSSSSSPARFVELDDFQRHCHLNFDFVPDRSPLLIKKSVS